MRLSPTRAPGQRPHSPDASLDPAHPWASLLLLLYPPAPTPNRTQGLRGSHHRPFIAEGTRPSTKASSLMPHTTAPPGGL